jgi:hypothetical protein
MSAQQFLEMLFARLPDFFEDEAELRTIWSVPETGKKLLGGLAQKDFGHDQLAEMQRILYESCQSVENLDREIFLVGFELLHPTAGSGIMERLCAEGRAEKA